MRYDPDHRGMARLLVQTSMANPLEGLAEDAIDYAMSISPVESGNYASSFEAHAEVEDGRQTVTIVNTADYASYVEWGGRGTEGHHVLAKVADFIEAESVSFARR